MPRSVSFPQLIHRSVGSRSTPQRDESRTANERLCLDRLRNGTRAPPRSYPVARRARLRVTPIVGRSCQRVSVLTRGNVSPPIVLRCSA